MDIVMIKCPNCGASVERREGEYFLKCPYCGMEVCFDDIKEEAQIGVLQNKLSAFEQNDIQVEAARQRLKSYCRMRNVSFGVMCLMTIVGFDLVSLAGDDDPQTGLGALITLGAWGIAFFAPLLLALVYPGYNIMTGTTDKYKTVKMWLKLSLVTVGLIIVSLIVAFIIEEIISAAAK